MKLFALGVWELCKAAARGRLTECVLELGFAAEEGALSAGDWEMVRAVRWWWFVRWADRRHRARLRRLGFSEVTIEAELDAMRRRVRRVLAEADADRVRDPRP